MKKLSLRERLHRFVPWFVLASLILSAAFTAIRIIFAPSEAYGGEYEKLKSDYVLMLIQCLLGIFAMLLPSILNHRFKIVIPHQMLLLYVIFLYCAIFLGEVRSFYYKVPYWDTILHAFSGGMLGALGFSLIGLLNNAEAVKLKMSPRFVALFAFFFALAFGALWEIYEFTVDGLLSLNMQKFALEDGTPLVGRAALFDTMKDLIVDTVGAFIVSIIGYFSLKRTPTWISGFEIRT
ncbi:hypothetical protein LJC34_00530, partial [Oscillospiraceae bacterium OttesenSCG-928-G22]|nr:hypothetical protein [Oscillospiraceae bacterium OttesenSCG-928-G22]